KFGFCSPKVSRLSWFWLAVDGNGNGSHAGRHDRFELGGKPGEVRISQARQEGAKGQQRFLGNQVEVVGLEVEQTPEVRGLVFGLIRRLILTVEVRRDRFRRAPQRADVQLKPQLG